MKGSRTRRLGRTLLFCLFAFSAAILSEVGCAYEQVGGATASVQPVTLTIGYPHITGIDPLHGLQAAARLISSEGLVSLGRDGRPQPRLAERWTESPDGLLWTIYLRPNAVFHDGTPVTSTSVRASLERSLQTMDRDLSPGLSDIVSIDSPSPRALVIRLRRRSTFLLDDLTVAITKADSNGTQVGTGPFVSTSTAGNEVVMVAVDRYYRGRPYIDRIVWKAYPAVRTAWAALMRGEVDFLYEVGPEAVEFVEGESSINVFQFLRSYLYGIILNSARPALSDPQVRRSLSYAVDRPAFVKQALSGHGTPALNAAWPEHWAYDPSAPSYSYDPSRSVALLEKTGAILKARNATERPSRIQFTCLVPEGFALWERMALMVQRNLSEIDVDMRLESLPFEAFNRRIASGDFDAVALEFVAGNGPSRPYTFWYSRSRRNAWGYHNDALDASLDDLRHAVSEAEYREAFRRFQIASSEDPPAILLAFGETTRAVSKRFNVLAPVRSDILPTIADWRPAAVPGTTN